MNRLVILLAIFGFLFGLPVLAQDVIILKNNEPIPCKIITVSKDSVTYAHISYTPGPIESIKRDQVMVIHFDDRQVNPADPQKRDTINSNNRSSHGNKTSAARDSGLVNVCYSMILPGWGDLRVREIKKPYWLLGVISYGMIGGSVYCKLQSEKIYKNYKSVEEINSAAYQDANKLHHAYLVLGGIGVSIWLGDVLLTGLKGFNNQRNKRPRSVTKWMGKPEFLMGANDFVGWKWTF